MRPLSLLQEVDHEVATLLPQAPRPAQKALAAAVVGSVQAESVVLNRAASAAPGTASAPSTRRRFQRLVANPRLDLVSSQDALMTRVFSGRTGRLDLTLDATTTGASRHDPGTTTLLLAQPDARRAQPLLWRSWASHQPEQDWQPVIRAFLDRVDAARPAATQPVLMTDRGLSGGPLARAAVTRGWHLLLRVQRTTRLQQPDGTVLEIGDLVPAPGTSALLTGVRLFAPRARRRGRWERDWADALVLNVVAIWRVGDPEPWLLVTDLPAQRRRCTEYRRRTWQEECHRDGKRLGLEWQHSRVRQPERVERVLLILALAMLWLLALGQRVVRYGWRRQLDDASRVTLSRFQLGVRWLRRLRVNGLPLPCHLRFLPVHAAPIKLS
jgi:hypothetical protein